MTQNLLSIHEGLGLTLSSINHQSIHKHQKLFKPTIEFVSIELNRNKDVHSQQNPHTSVSKSFTCVRNKLKPNPNVLPQRIIKQTLVYPCYGVLLSHKKEAIDTYNNLDEFLKVDARGKKSNILFHLHNSLEMANS